MIVIAGQRGQAERHREIASRLRAEREIVGIGGPHNGRQGRKCGIVAEAEPLDQNVEGAARAVMLQLDTWRVIGNAADRCGDIGDMRRVDEEKAGIGVEEACHQPGQATRSILGRRRVTQWRPGPP